VKVATAGLRLDRFDHIGFMKLKGYIIQRTLNNAYTVSEMIEAICRSSGDNLTIAEFETLLARNNIMLK
jgi:hypothetical protein